MLDQLWAGTKAKAASLYNSPASSSFRSYSGSGAMWAGGFEPIRGVAGNPPATIWGGFNTKWSKVAGQAVPDALGRSSTTGMSAGMRILGSGAGAAFSGYNIIKGYQDGGLIGAKDSAAWEVAMGSAVARFAYGTVGSAGPSHGISASTRLANIGIKTAGTRIAFGGGAGMASGIARTMGAGLGASLGQAVLGTPGAFMGAYVGAAPIRFAATHPLIAGGMATAAAAAAVGYGAYSVVKGGLQAGYDHRQNQRGIDTSGSMAAFMTQGAQTMRARSVQAIHKSHMNARSALGQEANFMHMPSKNYHSRYR